LVKNNLYIIFIYFLLNSFSCAILATKPPAQQFLALTNNQLWGKELPGSSIAIKGFSMHSTGIIAIVAGGHSPTAICPLILEVCLDQPLIRKLSSSW